MWSMQTTKRKTNVLTAKEDVPAQLTNMQFMEK